MRKGFVWIMLCTFCFVAKAHAQSGEGDMFLRFKPHSIKLSSTYDIALKKMIDLHKDDSSFMIDIFIYGVNCQLYLPENVKGINECARDRMNAIISRIHKIQPDFPRSRIGFVYDMSDKLRYNKAQIRWGRNMCFDNPPPHPILKRD